MSDGEQRAAFWIRARWSDHMVVALQRSEGAPLRAAGYSNQQAEPVPSDCLPDPETVRANLRASGVWCFGRDEGPDEVLWSVNLPMRERLSGGPGRVVHRLVREGTTAAWEAMGEAGEADLSRLEERVRWEETRPERDRALAEDAEIEARGFHVASRRHAWTYRERGLLVAEPPRQRESWRKPWLAIEVPEERDAGAAVLRPWCMWTAVSSWWRPEDDAALDAELRARVVARLAAWLADRGEPSRVVEALPSPAAPVAIPRVTMEAMQTILAFLLASGHRLASGKPVNPLLPRLGDPMEALRGRGAPRKWYPTPGGEDHVHLEGRIPVERVRSAFRFPAGDREHGTIDVSPERILGTGGEVRAVYLWGEHEAAPEG